VQHKADLNIAAWLDLPGEISATKVSNVINVNAPSAP